MRRGIVAMMHAKCMKYEAQYDNYPVSVPIAFESACSAAAPISCVIVYSRHSSRGLRASGSLSAMQSLAIRTVFGQRFLS